MVLPNFTHQNWWFTAKKKLSFAQRMATTKRSVDQLHPFTAAGLAPCPPQEADPTWTTAAGNVWPMGPGHHQRWKIHGEKSMGKSMDFHGGHVVTG